jgi:hypothetical protein
MYDAFAAKLSADGDPLWIETLAEPTRAIGTSVAALPDDVIVFGGYFANSITLGGMLLTGTPGDSIFVVAMDAQTQQHLWWHVYPDSMNSLLSGVLFDLDAVDDSLVLAGRVPHPTDFGNAMPVGGNGMLDAVVVRLDAGGNTVWARGFGGGRDDQFLAATIDAGGNVLVVGDARSASFDMGGGPVMFSGDDTWKMVAGKLDPDGEHVWSKGFSAPLPGSSHLRGVAADHEGNVYVTGHFTGTLTLDFDAMTQITTTSPTDGVVMKLSGADGSLIWYRQWDANPGYAHDVAIDDAGHVIVVGAVEGTPTFGSDEMVAPFGIRDAVAVAYTTDGVLLWSRSVGATGANQDVYGIEIVADAAYFAGSHTVGLTAGASVLSHGGDQDPFVVRLRP